MKARDADALHYSQRHIADEAERLLKALPKVAMIALVDEATGYQQIRAHDELQKILAVYILPEHRPWLKVVLPSRVHEGTLSGLRLELLARQSWPRVRLGKLIRQLIYKPLPTPVLPQSIQLQQQRQRKRRHHQHLTEDTGLGHFKGQLSGVMALLRATPYNKREFFWSLDNRAYGRQGTFDLGDDLTS